MVQCLDSRDFGSYFFGEDKIAVPVTSQRYACMLNNVLFPDLQKYHVDMSEMWLQQDGATAPTTRASTEIVRQIFPGHDISRFVNIP